MLELYNKFFSFSCDLLNSSSWKWIRLGSILFLLRRSCKIVSYLKWKQNGSHCDRRTAKLVLLLTTLAIFSLECAVSGVKNMTRTKLGFSKKNSDVQVCYIFATRRTDVMMLPRTGVSSLSNMWWNVYYIRVTMEPWKSIAASCVGI